MKLTKEIGQAKELEKGNSLLLRDFSYQQTGILSVSFDKDRPWKYQPPADAIIEVLEEDECKVL